MTDPTPRAINSLPVDTTPDPVLPDAARAPNVRILQPVDSHPPIAPLPAGPPTGPVNPIHNPVTLEGLATDQSDGDLSHLLEWSSDVDGHLAVGALVEVHLTIGQHNLTARVNDSDGLMGNATVVVTAVRQGAEPMDWVGEEDEDGGV